MTKCDFTNVEQPPFQSAAAAANVTQFQQNHARQQEHATNGHYHGNFVHKADQNGSSPSCSLMSHCNNNGGTASGKTSVCNRIMRELAQDSLGVHERRVAIISADSFYKALTPSELLVAKEGKFNFDHPDALDASQIVSTVRQLKRGEKVEIPVYDFVHHRPDPHKTETVYPAAVVIVEGILIFHFRELRELFHMKLFVDLDADIRLARRVLRDSAERGRELRGILRQYTTFVKPAFEDFCLPTKTYADIIIPRGAENDIAIELICQHIRNFLAMDGDEK